MKKNLLIILGIVLAIVLSLGIILSLGKLFTKLNENREPITTDEFETIMKNEGYNIYDVTSQFSQYGNYIEKALVAKREDYQIEFYKLSSKENAINMYNTNKTKFESQKDKYNTSSLLNLKNYSSFSMTTDKEFKYISTIDDTFLYSNVLKSQKENVKEAIKKIKY